MFVTMSEDAQPDKHDKGLNAWTWPRYSQYLKYQLGSAGQRRARYLSVTEVPHNI